MEIEVNSKEKPKHNKFIQIIIDFFEQIYNFFLNQKKKSLITENNEIQNEFDYRRLNNGYKNNNDNNDNYIDNQTQMQMQANKQKLKQLESQTYSNRTMARLISTAELYALSVNCYNEQIYKKFDEFDNLNRKTKDELKGELILQINCFKLSYQSYVKKYKNYDYPDDYDKEKTIEELKKIEENINDNDKKFYQAIIKLLNDDTNIPSFEEELNELEEGEEQSDKKDPKLQLETDIPIMRYLDGIRKNLKQNYLDNPMNCKIRLNLNESMEKNEEFEKLIKKLDSKNNNEKEKKFESTKIHRSSSVGFFNNKDKKIEDIKYKIKHRRKNSSGILSLKKTIDSYYLNYEENKSNYSCGIEDCRCCSKDKEDLK